MILGGNLFTVDRAKGVFMPERRPAYAFSFALWKVDRDVAHARLEPVTCRLFPECPATAADMRYQKVTIPGEFLSPHFHGDEVYASEVNRRSREEKWDSLLIDQPIRERLSGKLPTIEIGSKDYFVDLRNEMLIGNAADTPILDLKFFWRAGEGKFIEGFLHTPSLRMVKLSAEECLTFPEDVVLVRIPNYVRLDPVEYARKIGMRPASLLHDYLLTGKMTGELLPIKESEMVQRAAEFQILDVIFETSLKNRSVKKIN